MGSIYDWSTTASDNGNSDATVNYAEGQTPASLNNSARAAMARVAAWLKSLGAAITHGGSSNAYTLTLPTGHQITAYATGMRFLWKPNGNSSGSVTLNVDGVGAKKVFLPSGSQAGSGHITSGTLLDVVYDATLDSSAGGFQIVGSSSALTAQPLDATLTTLAALAWVAGNPLVQLIAADTASLTLTPSVTSVTATNSGSSASVSAVNSSAAALMEIERTDAHGSAYIGNLDYYGKDSAGNRQLYARQRVFVTDNTSTSEDAQLIWHVITNGSLADKLGLTGAGLFPIANDGLGLGFGTLAFSDLFLASGGVINWNNGDVTMTHSSNALEVAGGGFAAPLLESSETTGTLTVASRNRIVRCSGGVTLDDGVFAKEDWLVFDAGASNRTFTRAAGLTMYVNGVNSATATLPANTSGGAIWRSSTVVVLSGAFY